MTKKEVERWCKLNNHILIDLREKISMRKVITIAERAVNVLSIKYKRRRHRTIFARNLAISYLKDIYPHRKLIVEMEMQDTAFRIVVGKDILNDNKKFEKKWQTNAVKFFKNKIEEIESSL